MKYDFRTDDKVRPTHPQKGVPMLARGVVMEIAQDGSCILVDFAFFGKKWVRPTFLAQVVETVNK